MSRCGLINVEKGCKSVTDETKPYPDCCTRVLNISGRSQYAHVEICYLDTRIEPRTFDLVLQFSATVLSRNHPFIQDKKKQSYIDAMRILTDECEKRQLHLQPLHIVMDFKQALHECIVSTFPQTKIKPTFPRDDLCRDAVRGSCVCDRGKVTADEKEIMSSYSQDKDENYNNVAER
uniref:Single domain-containing protein n=1 Tax=Timema tahoe TaxID=61484 RepID=A0A7R9FNJ3_9NEOP|nr:unnamed protein product [Timema tahoe]